MFSLPVIEKISKIALFGMIFFIPFSNATTEICCGILLLFILIDKCRRPDFKPLAWPGIWVLIVFILLCAVSLFNSGTYMSQSLHALFLKWIKYILVFLALPLVLRKREDAEQAVGWFLISASIVVFDAIIQKCFGFDLLRHRPIALAQMDGHNFSALTANFKHYNGLGAYLVVVLLMVLALLVSGRQIWRKRLLVLAGFLCIVFVLTYSRGAWVGFGAGLLVMMFLSRKYLSVLSLAGILAAVMLLCHGSVSRVLSIFIPGGDSSRYEYWQNTLLLIKQHPFIGQGIGTFMGRLHEQSPFLIPIYAHNCYLQIWAETGIFSLLAFVVFLGCVLFRACRVYRKSADPVLLGAVCGLSAFLVHAFFDNHLYSLALAFVFWVMLGFVVTFSDQDVSNR
ncbi:MAG: O-antigen ligase family protein [Candidatus Omnitrophica bacterium]|nr:O-antigen ligase family protein [Candidatus Omnitrophota bacterium]